MLDLGVPFLFHLSPCFCPHSQLIVNLIPIFQPTALPINSIVEELKLESVKTNCVLRAEKEGLTDSLLWLQITFCKHISFMLAENGYR